MASLTKPSREEMRQIFEGLLNRIMHVKDGKIGQYKLLSERELVHTAIEFANDSKAIDEMLALLLGAASSLKISPSPKGAKNLSLYADERARFRELLSLVVNGEIRSHVSDVAPDAERMLLIPHIDQNGSVRYWYLPQTLSAVLSYVTVLLGDPAKSYGRDLKQCQLERCGRFFFVQRPKTGRPRSTYCSDAHMLEAHQAAAPERVRRSRANRKRKSTRRRK